VEAIRASLPEMPEAKRRRFAEQYALPEYDVKVLTGSYSTASYFETVTELTDDPKQASNWVMGPLTSELNARGLSIEESPVTPQGTASVIRMVAKGTITGKMAKDVYTVMFDTGRSAEEIVAAEGLEVVGGEDELGPIIGQAIADNPKAVEDYRAGKQKAKGAIVGAVMKATKGQADPATLNRLIDERLLS